MREGLTTGSNKGHSHVLMRDGKTSVNHGHFHTWNPGAKKTGNKQKHFHAVPHIPKK